jgi:hypothetical protein
VSDYAELETATRSIRRSTMILKQVSPPIRRRAARKAGWGLLAASFLFLASSPSRAAEDLLLHFHIEKEGKLHLVQGRILASLESGAVLVESRDGYFWPLVPSEISEKQSMEEAFSRLEARELSEQFLKELPAGFRTYETRHYLILHDTSNVYVRWCGSLLERLHAAFINSWKHKGLSVSSPDYPCVVVLFAHEAEYREYAQREGVVIDSVVAYYNLQTNRVAMYDLTGVEAAGGLPGRTRSTAAINQLLAQPQTAQAVATMVHEATHQIAFNCGLHRRMSDVPLWVSEGIAVYFETPDLTSARGWKTIGGVNWERLNRFNQYLGGRNNGSLRTLLQNDDRFRDVNTAIDAYAEAWALNYFLLRQRSDDYCKYLKSLSTKPYLVQDDEATRVQEFQAAFGDVSALDSQFLRFMSEVR